MRLGEKVRYLRTVEGNLRGLGRPLTQQEVVSTIQSELGQTLSQSYLSQIENGSRPHLTNVSRNLLAQFFKVHPGYLVDDPEEPHSPLLSPHPEVENRVDVWLAAGAEKFRDDPELSAALLSIARRDDTRQCLLLLQRALDRPELWKRWQKELGL